MERTTQWFDKHGFLSRDDALPVETRGLGRTWSLNLFCHLIELVFIIVLYSIFIVLYYLFI